MLIIFGLLRQPVFHGNPTTYRGKAATWAYGRQLATYDGNTFAYDARGRRTAKNGITFTYDSNGNLIKQSNGLEFFYDHTGVFAVKHNNTTYFYRKDAQANIVALLDNTGAVVVKYKYDAWGNCKVLNANGTEITDDTHIGILNPFRYRSYYYDTGIGLYFLKTRYYDPEIGRFITIDDISYLDSESINGLNLYAYCLNNPIMYVDYLGTIPEWAAWIISGLAVVGGIALIALTGPLGGLIGGALVAAGVGSLVGGYTNKAAGGSFSAGYWGGAVSGFITGLGAGLGGFALYAAAETAGLVMMANLGASAIFSFAGGFLGNYYGSMMVSNIDKTEFDKETVILNSIVLGTLNIFAGFGAGISFTAGVSGTTVPYKIVSTLISMGTEAIYDISSYAHGKFAKNLVDFN